MPTYKKQDNQQSNDWGYASTINRTIDNIDAIVGGEQLKESVNSVSTRVDKLNNALDNTLVGINQTLQETQTAVQNTIAEYIKKMESLKTDTESDVNTVIQAINKVKDTTGDKANLYQYFNDDTGNERRNLVQTANKMLEMIGYNAQTNHSIEDLTTNDKSSIVKAVNELDGDIGDTTTLTTTNKGNIVGAVNEIDKEIGDITIIEEQVKQDSLVQTINQLNNLIGVLSSLTTIAKKSIVEAINELNKNVVKSATLDRVVVNKVDNQLQFILPKATANVQGVVIIGTGINVHDGKISTSKEDIGLPQVDNTSDADKPISNKTQEALNLKSDKTELEAVNNTLQANITETNTRLGDVTKLYTATKTSVVAAINEVYEQIDLLKLGK